jgi:hypothetical protein
MTDGSGGITPVGGLGMLWYPVKTYGDFKLKFQFREGRTDGDFSNGGAFVRFPKGWSRPDVGHYAIPEEFVVLDGTLSLNGETWPRGAHAWIPAFQRRHGLGSASGCLVFAWFGGTPRWIPGEPPSAAAPAKHRSWIEGRRFHRVTPALRETLDLDDWTWRYGEASA